MTKKVTKNEILKSRFLVRKDKLTNKIISVISPNGLQIGLSGSSGIIANFDAYGKSRFYEGLSGSLTNLPDGTSYLKAGSNVTISSASNGAVTISSTGGGGGTSTGASFFSSTTAGSIFTTGSTAFVGGAAATDAPADQGADVFFFVSGSIDSLETATTGSAIFGGDIYTSGTSILSGTSHQAIPKNFSALGGGAGGFMYSGIYPNMVTFDVTGSGDNAFIELGHMFSDVQYPYALTGSADAFLFVSGAAGSRGTSVRGTAVFAGDIATSGSIFLLSEDSSADAAPKIVLNRSGSSPADDDLLGQIIFEGSDEAGNIHTYARMASETNDVTAGAEDGVLTIKVTREGTERSILKLANNEVAFNDEKQNIDFRIESDDETHMLFMDAAVSRISIGDSTDAPAATLEITNHATAGAYGVPLLQLNSNDTNEYAVDINAANIDETVMHVTADALTDSFVMDVTADALTTGGILNLVSDSSDTSARTLVTVKNDNTAAVGTVVMHLVNDAIGGFDDPILLIESTANETHPVLELKNSNASTTGEPIMIFTRSDTSAEADDMSLGTLIFRGVDADNNNEYYAQIKAFASDVTTGDEGGLMTFVVKAGGTAGTAANTNLFAIGGEDVANTVVPSVVVNEDGINCDFRVESDAEDEAIFLDASAETLYINKGESAFTTQIHSTNDVAMTVGAAGVIFNEDGHSSNDFRVETNNKTHALFVDASHENVLFGANSSPSDIFLFVSGGISEKGTASARSVTTFGGDVHTSGSLFISGTAPNATGIAKVSIGCSNTTPAKVTLDVEHDFSTHTFENQLADGEGGGTRLRFGSFHTTVDTAGKLCNLTVGSSVWRSYAANNSAQSGSFLAAALDVDGGADEGLVLLRGFLKVPSGLINGTLATGAPLYASNDTAGEYDVDLPSDSDDVVRIVGYCIDTDSSDALVWFDPDKTWVTVS